MSKPAYLVAGALVGIPLLAFAIFGAGAGTLFANEASAGYGQDKVAICHKGKTLTVAAPAVQAHVGHGDTVGACS